MSYSVVEICSCEQITECWISTILFIFTHWKPVAEDMVQLRCDGVSVGTVGLTMSTPHREKSEFSGWTLVVLCSQTCHKNFSLSWETAGQKHSPYSCITSRLWKLNGGHINFVLVFRVIFVEIVSRWLRSGRLLVNLLLQLVSWYLTWYSLRSERVVVSMSHTWTNSGKNTLFCFALPNEMSWRVNYWKKRLKCTSETLIHVDKCF